jgi:hypothetical protein
MIKIRESRNTLMFRFLKILTVLKVIPVSNYPDYKFKLLSLPTFLSCLIWFLLPSLLYCLSEWSVEMELSVVEEYKSKNVILNR